MGDAGERPLVGRLLRLARSGDVEAAQFLIHQLIAGDQEVEEALRSHDLLIELLRIAGREFNPAWTEELPDVGWTNAELRELLGDGRQLSDLVFLEAERQLAARWLRSQPSLSDIAERDHWFTRRPDPA